MDASRFDEAARFFSSGKSRRTLLTGVAALALSLADGVPFASAGKRRKKKCKRKECGGKCGRCRDGKECRRGKCACPDGTEECDGQCVNLLADAGHCGACNHACPGSNGCRHGTCTCDPFNNTCPLDETPFQPGDRCGCGAVVSGQFVAACVDGNSACDLDTPCFSDDDCPARSVCLKGCADSGNPNGPNRCSTPCN